MHALYLGELLRIEQKDLSMTDLAEDKIKTKSTQNMIMKYTVIIPIHQIKKSLCF